MEFFMKAINNLLFPTIRELFENLNLLRGLLFVLEKRLDNYRKQVADNNVDLSCLLAGSSLVIRKLTEFPSDGSKNYYATGKFNFESTRSSKQCSGTCQKQESFRSGSRTSIGCSLGISSTLSPLSSPIFLLENL